MIDLELVDITDPLDSVLDKIKSLYIASFPEDERRPWDNIIFMIENHSPFFRMRAILDSNADFYGFLTSWNLPVALYIEHFAIDKNARSKGVGGIIISDIVESSLPLPVVVEVELPENNSEAARRISFYERNGFKAMSDFPYFQPPYRKDLESVPLMLMTSSPLEDPKSFVIMLHTFVYNQ